MRRAAAVLALALACGVKGPPQPPLRETAPADGGTPASEPARPSPPVPSSASPPSSTSASPTPPAALPSSPDGGAP